MGQHFAQKPFVVLSIFEVAAAAEHQRLFHGSLEAVMALLDVSILMGFAGVDGLSFQAIVGQQGAITLLEQITIAKVIHRALSRSVRCIWGTPPSSQRAFWSPWLRLSKLSEKQTVAVSQLE